jgi:hypothetical protein
VPSAVFLKKNPLPRVQHSGKKFDFFKKEKLFPECLFSALGEELWLLFIKTLFPECRCPGTRGTTSFLLFFALFVLTLDQERHKKHKENNEDAHCPPLGFRNTILSCTSIFDNSNQNKTVYSVSSHMNQRTTIHNNNNK